MRTSRISRSTSRCSVPKNPISGRAALELPENGASDLRFYDFFQCLEFLVALDSRAAILEARCLRADFYLIVVFVNARCRPCRAFRFFAFEPGVDTTFQGHLTAVGFDVDLTASSARR